MANSNLGDVIKKARQADNLTQSELAAKLGCSAVTISRWEKNKFKPSHNEMIKLKEILNIDLEIEEEIGTNSHAELIRELNRITMSIEDLRLDAIRRERNKFYKIIASMILMFILILIGLSLWTDWKDPDDPDDEPMLVYYYSIEEENQKING